MAIVEDVVLHELASAEKKEKKEPEKKEKKTTTKKQEGSQLSDVTRSTPLGRELEASGMSEKEVADRAGVGAPTISRIMRKPAKGAGGQPLHRNARQDTMKKVGKVLGVGNVGRLFGLS
jgi:hypothetical protein